MNLRWHGEARAEADAAAAFYRDKRSGLAQHFLDSLEPPYTGFNVIHRPIVRWRETYASAGCHIFPTA
jgi:hypothetical protein